MTELIKELVTKLGVQEGQATGGAGLIFKLAQQKLGGEFAKVAAVVPGIQALTAAAPQPTGAAKVVGGLLGALGGSKVEGLSDLAGLASGFAQLKLDSGMVARFLPIVLEFVKGRGGQEVMSILAKVLQK